MERKSRHSRSRQKDRFYISEQDLEILRLLARYRYLRTTFIQAHTGRDRSSVNYALRKLFDQGYIDKPREQRRGYNNLYCPDIYELDGKGNGLLLERGIREFEITRLYRQKVNGPVKNFAHSMMICDALASLELGVRQSPDCQFIGWQEIVARAEATNPMKLPCTVAHTHANGRYERLETHIVPDGLFGIRYPNGQAAFFALEAEHYNPIEPTNLGRASFLKKLLAYRDIAKTGVYKTNLKIPNLRVLVVSPTEERVRHQIQLTERIAKASNLFLFNVIPVQEELPNAPPPFPELFTVPWQRAGMPDGTISTG